MQDYISHCRQISDKGLVLFAHADIPLQVFEPKRPCKVSLYRCERRFLVEGLEELESDQGFYAVGLVVVSGQDASLYSAHFFEVGKDKLGAPTFRIDISESNSCHNHAHSKTRRGGQSAPRFMRQRQNDNQSYAKNIVDKTLEAFGCQDTQLLLVVGAKDKLVLIDPLLRERARACGFSAQQVVLDQLKIPVPCDEKRLAEVCLPRVCKALGMVQDSCLEPFWSCISRASDKLVFGENEITEALKSRQVHTLWASHADLKRLCLEDHYPKLTVVPISNLTVAGSEFLSKYQFSAKLW